MTVAVLGLGLIGGSAALAARAAGERVVGYDPDPRTRERALSLGALDEAAETPAAALRDADVAIAAAPIGALAQLVRAALREAPVDCVVTDVGSTKRALLAELGGEDGIERFVGGHPLAGSEQSGVEHARADLFSGACWCLVPSVQRDRAGQERAAEAEQEPAAEAGQEPAAEGRAGRERAARLRSLVESFGARPVEIDAERHDRVMAAISHLPHVIANVLVAGVAGFDAQERALAAGGPSFRDATRVAGASSAIWTDIYLSNADLLMGAIDDAIAELTQVRASLAAGDAEALAAWNDLARDRRRSLLP